MDFLEITRGEAWVATGLSLLAVTFLWRQARQRTITQRDSTQQRHPARHTVVVATGAVDHASNRAPTDAGEPRILSLTRDVESRTTAQIHRLDQLIAEADREILRLEQVLAESRQVLGMSGNPRRPDAAIHEQRRDAA
ncbi:MAG: hypothetical protein JSS02_20520 [Planctomycetes bacterium]|nr:hypothetical protein [Planctomycetota bacterium]